MTESEHLIGAASDLLAVCRDYVAWLDRAPDRECIAAIDEQMRAAIVKAEGGTEIKADTP